MKKRLLSTLVILCMVIAMLPVAALAADAVFPDMPNDYSTSALQAAVDNGLLTGADGMLLPRNDLSRAEMAAIINRAFGAVKKDALDKYTDVPAGAWYAEDMAKAVHMKTFKGDGTSLHPEAPITRQEAFIVLSRALALPKAEASALIQYADANQVAGWAKADVAAMAAAGYIKGDGLNLYPTANISRADFAVVMDNIIKQYIKTAGEYAQVGAGTVMINVPAVTLRGVTVYGDLILGDGVAEGDIVLDGITIDGRLLARGGGADSVRLTNRSSVGTIVIAKVDGNVRIIIDDGCEVGKVIVVDGKDDVIIEGDVGEVVIEAAGVNVIVKKGVVDDITLAAENAKLTAAEGAVISSVVVDETAKNAVIEADGDADVKDVEIAAEGVNVTGDGEVESVTVTGNNANVNTVGTKLSVAAGVTGTMVGPTPVAGGETGVTVDTTGAGSGDNIEKQTPPAPPPGGGGGGGGGEPVVTVYYHISFDANGGTGEMSDRKVPKGGRVKAPECTFTAPVNSFFTHWETDDGTEYEVGEYISNVTEDMTLYAQWVDEVWLDDILYAGASDVNDDMSNPPYAVLTTAFGTTDNVVTVSIRDGSKIVTNVYNDIIDTLVSALNQNYETVDYLWTNDETNKITLSASGIIGNIVQFVQNSVLHGPDGESDTIAGADRIKCLYGQSFVVWVVDKANGIEHKYTVNFVVDETQIDDILDAGVSDVNDDMGTEGYAELAFNASNNTVTVNISDGTKIVTNVYNDIIDTLVSALNQNYDKVDHLWTNDETNKITLSASGIIGSIVQFVQGSVLRGPSGESDPIAGGDPISCLYEPESQSFVVNIVTVDGVEHAYTVTFVEVQV